MISLFEQELTKILAEFKKDVLSPADAVAAVEELIVHSLGLTLYSERLRDELLERVLRQSERPN